MKPVESIVHGTLNADGTLELDEQPKLPPGRVVVVVRSTDSDQARRSVWDVLDDIRRQHQAEGYQGRSKEEIDEQIDALRNEFEEHQAQLDRIRRTSPSRGEGSSR
jgi:hypothetical protein